MDVQITEYFNLINLLEVLVIYVKENKKKSEYNFTRIHHDSDVARLRRISIPSDPGGRSAPSSF